MDSIADTHDTLIGLADELVFLHGLNAINAILV
jgi:hypothetical protein